MAEMESLLDDIDMLLDYNELAGLLSPDIVASMILEQQGEELAVAGTVAATAAVTATAPPPASQRHVSRGPQLRGVARSKGNRCEGHIWVDGRQVYLGGECRGARVHAA